MVDGRSRGDWIAQLFVAVVLVNDLGAIVAVSARLDYGGPAQKERAA
jgi:hypothetical protein